MADLDSDNYCGFIILQEVMVQLRTKYEEEVQHRNARGIQLIERNEEVCIFYEKVNIQGMFSSRKCTLPLPFCAIHSSWIQ